MFLSTVKGMGGGGEDDIYVSFVAEYPIDPYNYSWKLNYLRFLVLDFACLFVFFH